MFTKFLSVVFKRTGHLTLIDAAAKALASLKLIVAFLVHCHLSDVALHDVGSCAGCTCRIGHDEAGCNIAHHHACVAQDGFLKTIKG